MLVCDKLLFYIRLKRDNFGVLVSGDEEQSQIKCKDFLKSPECKFLSSLLMCQEKAVYTPYLHRRGYDFS